MSGAKSGNLPVCKVVNVADSKESEIECILESEDSLIIGISKRRVSNNVLI